MDSTVLFQSRHISVVSLDLYKIWAFIAPDAVFQEEVPFLIITYTSSDARSSNEATIRQVALLLK